MSTPIHHIIHNNTFWLSPQRCLYWEEAQALIVSDLHLGKTGHFRRQGIAVPQAVYKEDLQCLFSQIQYYKPKQLIIVGDLFHSKENRELDLFIRWRNDIPQVDVHLVKGNHDILKNEWYSNANIGISQEQLCIDQFIFTHEATAANCTGNNQSYIFSGHIHPGVSIHGLGRQSLTFPCYFFGEWYAVLPAFSKFTGVKVMHKSKGDHVFAIVNQSVMKV
ncbi:ligase-associated DNA damage response endonuclease PdeM [Ilyomonas limi]|uniref:Ligase-associated DNA damage response endonuclease PdeM n=2 Tax=Ilyomonas limi TaxID=2575867 RepID=A0A4U3L1F5_9BACT|nr:ligase-associated DNA damage response endonuclease PdeM [Ilyomonas limi]